jgi:hypothetical protein
MWPNGEEGLVVEDVDVLFRAFGSKYRTDKDGRFAEFEVKYSADLDRPPPHLRWAQERTFRQRERLFIQHHEFVGSYILACSDLRCLMAYGIDWTFCRRSRVWRVASLTDDWVTETVTGGELCDWIEALVSSPRLEHFA